MKYGKDKSNTEIDLSAYDPHPLPSIIYAPAAHLL